MGTELRPREVVTLFRGDDAASLQALRVEFERALTIDTVTSGAGNLRIGDAPASSNVVAAAAAYDAFLSEAAERATPVPLLGLGRKAWRDLVQRHPVREETDVDESGGSVVTKNPDDEEWGFNVETLPEDLVPASIETPAQRNADFLDDLTAGQWHQLYVAARSLNTGMGVDPRAFLSSRIVRSSGGISK